LLVRSSPAQPRHGEPGEQYGGKSQIILRFQKWRLIDSTAEALMIRRSLQRLPTSGRDL
jgi:hypothetical protein